MSAAQQRGRGDLEIFSEVVLVAIPRGDEEFRITRTRGRTGDGKDVEWISLRIFWKGDEGEWRPGKQGITIRARELAGVVEALVNASGVAPPPSASAAHAEPRARAPSSGAPVAPFGRSKGQPLSTLEATDLEWLAEALERSIADSSKATYRSKNQRDLEAVEAELALRDPGASRAPDVEQGPSSNGGVDDIPF